MNTIERAKSTPLYIQLKDKIKKDIRSGILRPGDRIPSESQLQKEYGMSRVTVRNAMEELTVEGYIIKVQGKGSFVAQSDMLRLPIGVTSFTEDAKLQGVQLISEVVKIELENIQTELDKELFRDKTDGKVLILKRIRKANGVPITIEENHLSPDVADIKNEDLTGSLYELLINKYHVIPSYKGRRSLKIIFADEEIARCLDLSLGTPVIQSEMCVFDVNGEPVHTGKDIIRGDNDRYFKMYL